MDGICYIMCPGTAINHHETDPNTSMKKISDTEIHIYAMKDLYPGDEICYNYNFNGTPPKWLADFVRIHKIPLPFSGFNDYMEK